MAVPHYPYLLFKMPTTKGILSLQGDLQKAYDCDVQAIQIVEKIQGEQGRREIAMVAATMNPQETEIPIKKARNW
jgi:Cu/Ag efflux pump CusA